MFDGVSHQVKNIFSRPVISTKDVTGIRIDNENTPDKFAKSLYGNSDIFYINALLNNITQKDLWPKTQLEFSDSISKKYTGYAFHILEDPSVKIERGDIIVLSSDLGNCSTGDIDCYPTYGIVHSWDPVIRKIWVKNYVIGSQSTATSEANFFKENNKFKIFKITPSGEVKDLNGISIKNESAFRADPNYTFVANTFTMKRVGLYNNSAHNFVYSPSNSDINPLQKNFNLSNDSETSIFTTFVGEYSSGNTNGTCSLLDAYILESNGQTGSDNSAFILDYRFIPTTVLDYLTAENEEERYIYAANRSAVPKIIDDIERQLNG